MNPSTKQDSKNCFIYSLITTCICLFLACCAAIGFYFGLNYYHYVLAINTKQLCDVVNCTSNVSMCGTRLCATITSLLSLNVSSGIIQNNVSYTIPILDEQFNCSSVFNRTTTCYDVDSVLRLTSPGGVLDSGSGAWLGGLALFITGVIMVVCGIISVVSWFDLRRLAVADSTKTADGKKYYQQNV